MKCIKEVIVIQLYLKVRTDVLQLFSSVLLIRVYNFILVEVVIFRLIYLTSKRVYLTLFFFSPLVPWCDYYEACVACEITSYVQNADLHLSP